MIFSIFFNKLLHKVEHICSFILQKSILDRQKKNTICFQIFFPKISHFFLVLFEKGQNLFPKLLGFFLPVTHVLSQVAINECNLKICDKIQNISSHFCSVQLVQLDCLSSRVSVICQLCVSICIGQISHQQHAG